MMIFLFLILVFVFVVSYCCYWVAFYNPESRHGERVEHSSGPQYQRYLSRLNELYRQLEEMPYESVSIHSHDGLKLAARYYHFGNDRPLQIMFHGYRGSGLRDMCGAVALAKLLKHNVLLVDQRAHGKSGGNTMTFGVLERYDCKRWAEYAAERFGPDCKIILYGVSMGAATVLMASELDLPANVVGTISDCPFSSPAHIIRKVCADMKFPAFVMYPFVVIGALVFGHFRIWEADCIRAAKKSKLPVLLIHGESDKFVPHEMSDEIYRACNNATYVKFPGAGHVLSFVSDEKRYEQVVNDFMKSILHA